MSDSESVDRTALRATIRETIQSNDPLPRSKLEGKVAGRGFPPEAVGFELDALEERGFVYLVGESEEVKIP